jgi:citrate synthase
MQGFLEELSRRKNDRRYLEILMELERDFRSRMEEKGKPLYPNVDFYSGAVYALLGIPTVLFTPIFAMARVSGWLAHILEQRRDNKLYRPASLYTGASARRYLPMADRR